MIEAAEDLAQEGAPPGALPTGHSMVAVRAGGRAALPSTGIVPEGPVEHGPPHAPPTGADEAAGGLELAVDVADAGERPLLGGPELDPHGVQLLGAVGHQALAAGSVQGRSVPLHHDDVEPRQPGADGRREAGRPAADDDDVDPLSHVRPPRAPGAAGARPQL